MLLFVIFLKFYINGIYFRHFSSDQSLLQHTKVSGAYCLGIFKNGNDQTTLLGGMVKFHWIVDNFLLCCTHFFFSVALVVIGYIYITVLYCML